MPATPEDTAALFGALTAATEDGPAFVERTYTETGGFRFVFSPAGGHEHPPWGHPMDVHVEYHHGNGHTDRGYAAVLLRNGAPWHLGGALIGMGTTRGAAIDDLVNLARYVVINGSNALMEHPLELAEREWLFNQIHAGLDCQPMHEALDEIRRTQTEGNGNG